ncbi:MAG: hypothetical protein B6I28_03450 [Fusobacteriia bacterium 4572_132]|nr:MAG: hypothetical protein B6I28_03450 [Fusobacteriia bacterium 4572_132]
MRNKYIFSGHQSFNLRDGWLIKGIELIEKEDGKNIFSKNELVETIDKLGIGANMVKSLKYWLEVLDIMDDNNNINTIIKEIRKYDEYFQRTTTLWLLHFFILNPNRKNRRVILWEIIAFKTDYGMFTKKEITELIDIETEKKYAHTSIEKGLNIFIKTYLNEKVNNKKEYPENNLISPMTRLKFLKKIKKTKTDEYYFRNIQYSEINKYLGYMIIKSIASSRESISKEEAYQKFKKIIKLDMYNFDMILKEIENENLISIDRAAGLNNIHFKVTLSEKEMIKQIYMDNN